MDLSTGDEAQADDLGDLMRELGMTAQDVEDTLAWAQQRADELLFELESDSDLLMALHAPPPVAPEPAPAPSSPPPSPSPAVRADSRPTPRPDVRPEPDPAPAPTRDPAPPAPAPETRRQYRRYSLEEPVRVRAAGWDHFVELYTEDISRGGMFVVTPDAPPLATRVAVTLTLPHGAGEVQLNGEVVRIIDASKAALRGVNPGFGLRFEPLTAERQKLLERLVTHARFALAESSRGDAKLSELGLATEGDELRLSLSDQERKLIEALEQEHDRLCSLPDHAVLGVEPGAPVAAIHGAFMGLAEIWHPEVSARFTGPELRDLATRIFREIEGAYQRMSSRSSRRAANRNVPPARGASPTERTDTFDPPASEGRKSRPGRQEPPRRSSAERDRKGGSLLARRLATRLGRIAGAENPGVPRSRTPDAADDSTYDRCISQAIEMMSDKRYGDAARVLDQALAARPDDRKARVLQSFARARKALSKRDIPSAVRHYETVLSLDPGNPTAKREMLMVTALRNRGIS